jgi:N-acyl-D-amino-acid deacylase
MCLTRAAFFYLTLLPRASVVHAVEAPVSPALDSRVTAALELGLPLVADAAMRYPEHRQCFSCHHQTLPLLALVAARRGGATIDENVLAAQTQFTHNFFAGKRETLGAGKHIGGRALTVGYGLWTFHIAKAPADETTTAMVRYLVKTQHDDGHWQVQTVRPPMEESSLSTTMIAILGLQQYGPQDTGNDSELKHQVDAAIAKATTWLTDAPAKSTEDKVARLWGLHYLQTDDVKFQTDDVKLQQARETLLSAQREDGGWPQLDDMESDAYATGQALAALLSTGASPDDDACRRGITFLLDTQQADGSWHVISRSDPVQVIFDNGDPHGLDQFISTPATCWALTALALWASETTH